ncbi:MAG: TonB-dependent receptor [Bacteroidales bacterium]|nr:TonB-dependent receptor [Bacteroidales bacterium]
MRNLNRLIIIIAVGVPSALEAQTNKDTIIIKEAIVSARIGAEKSGTGSIIIPSDMIRSSPALLGEPDILKTIQLLPGIQAGTEGLSGMYVRGGGSDENLILLDGVPIHCQGHLLGLFSPFQSEAVKEAVIHKGSFPARFGGRASSVLEINTSDSDKTETYRCLGLGLISDKFHIEGELAGNKTDYSVSGRGMHTFLMDGIFRMLKVPGNLWFQDLHARVSTRIDNRNSLSVNGFTSKDKLYYKEYDEKTDFKWGTSMAALKWKRRWSGDLASDIILAWSGYSMDTGIKIEGASREGYRTGLEDLVVKTDFIFNGLPAHGLRFGTETIRHMFKPESDYGNKEAGKVSVTGVESAFYAEDKIKVTGGFSVDAGLRMILSSSGGNTRLLPEPRFSASVGNDPTAILKASYSRVSQHIHQLSSTIAVLPVDLIVPVSRSIGPMISDQVAIGFSHENRKGWEMSLEGYWKRMSGVLEYKDDVYFIDDFSTWEEDVAEGIGRSYGVELFIRKNSGKTTGWFGYTLSKSERRFPDKSISGGDWFPCRYDCRHSITAVLGQTFGRGWRAGATWTYTSGGAITIPEADGSMPHRGNYRLSPSHRLDLGLSHRKEKRHGERVWNLGVYNTYNRKNPNLVIPVAMDEEDGPGSPIKTISFLPVIPSVAYTRVF